MIMNEGAGAAGGSNSFGQVGQGASTGASFGPWGAIIGAALGAVQGRQAQDQAAKQQKYNAEVIRNSPWLGMGQFRDANMPNSLGMVAQGGMQGFQQGKEIDKAYRADDINKAQLAYLQQKQSQGG